MHVFAMAVFVEVGPEYSWPQILVQTGLYGYVLFVAANLIGDGAELLLLCPNYAPLVGSIVIPILGAVPDGMMVLCSGLGPDAQEQVKVGVGALAGSTIMLLTLPWFLAIYSGRVDYDKNNGRLAYKCPPSAQASTWQKLDPKKKFSLTTVGVGIGSAIRDSAKFMLATCTTYLLIQGPALLVDKPFANTSEKEQSTFENPFAWVGLVASLAWLACYLRKAAHKDKTDEVNQKIVWTTVVGLNNKVVSLRGVLANFRDSIADAIDSAVPLKEAMLGPGSEAMRPHIDHLCKVMTPFFSHYDVNYDGKIDFSEFRMILHDLNDNSPPQQQHKLFVAADVDKSGDINFDEFVSCMMALTLEGESTGFESVDPVIRRASTASRYIPVVRKSGSFAGDGEEEEGHEEEDMPEEFADLSPEEQQRRIKRRAFFKMLLGSALVLFFTDPMCDMLATIGDKTGIDKFYVSFVLAPLASNASELVAAMKLANKKTKSSMVSSLSTLEGAAIMNNTFCLSIFLLLIVWKGLVWQFTAETVAILVIEISMAIIALNKRVQTLADGILILMLYPLSLIIVVGLESMGFD